MKRIVLTVVGIMAFGVSTGFTAPVNNLNQGQTAIGVVDETVYIQHKLSDNFTLGLQEDDINGQFNLDNNLRAIVGNRDFNHNSNFYLGAAVNAPIAPSLDGYASIIGAKDFKEVQVGANYNLTHNVDVNLNYTNVMPDVGSDRDRTSIGASFKF